MSKLIKKDTKEFNPIIDSAYNSIQMFAEVQLLKSRPGDRQGRCWAEILADTLIKQCEKGNMKAFDKLIKLLHPRQTLSPRDVIRFLTLYSPKEIKDFLNMTDAEIQTVEGKISEAKLFLSGKVDEESNANS